MDGTFGHKEKMGRRYQPGLGLSNRISGDTIAKQRRWVGAGLRGRANPALTLLSLGDP